MLEDYEAIMNMTDEQAAEVLAKMKIHVMGGRQNGKTVLFLSYNTAMQKAIQKLKGGWIPCSEKLPGKIEDMDECPMRYFDPEGERGNLMAGYMSIQAEGEIEVYCLPPVAWCKCAKKDFAGLIYASFTQKTHQMLRRRKKNER